MSDWPAEQLSGLRARQEYEALTNWETRVEKSKVRIEDWIRDAVRKCQPKEPRR